MNTIIENKYTYSNKYYVIQYNYKLRFKICMNACYNHHYIFIVDIQYNEYSKYITSFKIVLKLFKANQ